MSPLYTFRPKKTLILSPSWQRAMWYCERVGIPPRGRNTYILSGNGGGIAARGLRLDAHDNVIILEDFWRSRNAKEVYYAVQPCFAYSKPYVDLLSIPETLSRTVA